MEDGIVELYCYNGASWGKFGSGQFFALDSGLDIMSPHDSPSLFVFYRSPSARPFFANSHGELRSEFFPEIIDVVAGRQQTAAALHPLAAYPNSFAPQTLTWDGRAGDGRALASGVYFIKLQTSKMNFSQKLLLLR